MKIITSGQGAYIVMVEGVYLNENSWKVRLAIDDKVSDIYDLFPEKDFQYARLNQFDAALQKRVRDYVLTKQTHYDSWNYFLSEFTDHLGTGYFYQLPDRDKEKEYISIFSQKERELTKSKK